MSGTVFGAGDTKVSQIRSLTSSIFSGYQFFIFVLILFFFRKWGQKVKGTLDLNMREEKALTTDIFVILYVLTDAVRIMYTGFWEVGDISNLAWSGKLLVCSEVSFHNYGLRSDKL